MAFDIRDEEDEHHPDEFEEYDDVKQPTPQKFYRKKRFWYFCIPNTIVIIVVAVVLALYVIMPKIAQSLINKSSINLSQIDITNPGATSMDLVMQGNLEHTGPFHTDITFPDPISVTWNGIELGTTEIPGTTVASGGHGTLSAQSSFAITNATAFSEFSAYMLNADSFVWHLEGKLDIKALSHKVKGLTLSKDITVSAFNGLTGITIQKFSLPGDDPDGKGILINIDTVVTNPSSIQIYMGSLTLAISYKDTLMGYVTSSNLTMMRGEQTLSMTGYLIPQNTTQGLADVSEMMSRYIGNAVTDTNAIGYDVKPDGVNTLDWLSAAVKNLNLTIPLQSPTPLQLIKALNLGALGLVFTPETAYDPLTTSTGVLANYSMPDGFDFGIQFTQVANTFALSRNSVTIANLNSSYNPSSSDMAAGTLTFNLLQTPLIVPDASQVAFQEFNRDLTIGSDLIFNVVGEASVYANTSIGTVNLVNIPFNASTGLSGLQSLANPAPTITALQVTGGTTNALELNITVVIVNPSSISLSTGDIVFSLLYNGADLGTVTLPNLSIVPGANTVQAYSSINPAASPEGIELLTLYTSGAGAGVNIAGTSTSTSIGSLSLAFAALNIGSQMPGLEEKLLVSASLVVLNTTTVNGLAQTVVTVNNPFVPPMSIISIDSKITYSGMSVGTVVSTFSSPPVIPGTGQGTLTAALAMNTNPADLTALIRAQATKNGLSLDVFDALLSIQDGASPDPSIFNGFNVAEFVTKAMANLIVDITMTTTVKVGDYQVTIPYTQTGVPTATDETILRLIPLVGTPIAQILVSQSILSFDSINILNPADTSFQTDIVGAITQTGPLDAQIQFPNSVTVSYNGKAIGTMSMPTIDVTSNQGATLNLANVPFTVTDIDAFTDFTVYALNNDKFDWSISSTGLIVSALGVSFPGVDMTKQVTLDGFNKLPGLQLLSYIINTVDDSGLHLVISAALSNPSTIGMVIPTSEFYTSFDGQTLGPAIAQGLTLIPHGNTSFALNATISPDNGDLTSYLSTIFQNAVSGIDTPLKAQGSGAPGVSWLDTALKSLSLDTSLPALTEPPIASVAIDAMSMDFSCDSCVWAPIAVSTITAVTNLPFANGAPISQLSQNVQILDKNGAIVGTLNTPYAAASVTGNSVTSTSDSAPMTIADDSHTIYENFIGDLNAATTYELGLNGTANSILDLGALGQVEVKGISLDVTTSLKGLQGLNTTDWITLVGLGPVTGMILYVDCIVNIHNPSDLTLRLGDLQLNMGLSTEASGFAGVTSLSDLVLVPGDNQVSSYTLLTLTNPGALSVVSGPYAGPVPLFMYAFSGTSNNSALNAGLANMLTHLTIPFGGLTPIYSNRPYDADWTVKFLPTTVQDNIVEMTATFNNPYYSQVMHFVNAQPSAAENPSGNGGNLFSIKSPVNGANSVAAFKFIDSFQFDLQPNASKTVTFQMEINKTPFSSKFRDVVTSWIQIANTSGVTTGYVTAFLPKVLLGNDQHKTFPDFKSSAVYPSTGGALNLHMGSDFSLLLDWFDANFPAITTTTTTTATAAVTTVTSVAPTTTTTAAPSTAAATTVASSSPSPTPAATATASPTSASPTSA
ncbi:hypothetical protein BGX21_011130 [Mortierella sp. AD011]|nr:hypothetical protein BGX20_000794 [Mortierella sp. AD010]KAF9391877.1 hypothetical protein BGX21_011130 [Mortierella sp. AD011]